MARRHDFRRIGLLVPSSSSVQEQEFRRVLPEDITLHVARMRLSNVEADSTLCIAQEIEVESQKLADVDVDVIIFPATAPSSRLGIGYDQELIKRISAASGKPATTASTALLESLRVLSIKTAVLGAPWSAPVNQTVAAFIEANGVKSSRAGDARLRPQSRDRTPRSANSLRRWSPCEQTRSGRGCTLACGNWSTFSIIDQLEHDLGKPVLTTNQVSLWHSLKMMGSRPLEGLGVLLRDHLGDEGARYPFRTGT